MTYKANMIDVDRNTWWFDSSHSIHVSNSSRDVSLGVERSIYAENKIQSSVKDLNIEFSS